MIEMAITCLALNLYHEARGEPEIGQWAVAQVTMNRAEHDPAKVCDTVFKPRQFSWTNPLVEAPARDSSSSGRELHAERSTGMGVGEEDRSPNTPRKRTERGWRRYPLPCRLRRTTMGFDLQSGRPDRESRLLPMMWS